jgi:hypothetical protein
MASSAWSDPYSLTSAGDRFQPLLGAGPPRDPGQVEEYLTEVGPEEEFSLTGGNRFQPGLLPTPQGDLSDIEEVEEYRSDEPVVMSGD